MTPEWVLAVAIAVGRDVDIAAYDRWYDERHLPAILGCPGFESGARFTGVPESHQRDEQRCDLTLYVLSRPEALESEEFAACRGFESFASQVSWTTRLYRRRPDR